MIRPAACGLAVSLLAAQAWADTLLHLSETATVMASPDELDATLRVEAVSGTAADAQQRVNSAMSDALARVHQVPEVKVSTGGYSVWRSGPTPQDRTERWQAGQSLELKSQDGAALLKLIGELQQRGLAAGQLAWHLSPDAERKAREAATKQALGKLRGRIDEAAALLDLRFEAFKEVRLDSTAMRPPVMRMMAAAAAPAPATPPSAESTEIPVTATAEADAILLPR